MIAEPSIAPWIGATWPRKRTASDDAQLPRERAQRRLERPAAGDVEPQARAPACRASANARSSTMWPLIGISRPTQSSRGSDPRTPRPRPVGAMP